MEIMYNKQIIVSDKQYNKAMSVLKGIVAGRKKEGEHFLKLMIPKYKGNLLEILTSN